MKRTVFVAASLLFSLHTHAQAPQGPAEKQKNLLQGKILYERLRSFKFNSGDLPKEVVRSLSNASTHKLEVLFANNTSLTRSVANDIDPETGNGMRGMVIALSAVGAGSDAEVAYTNLSDATRVSQAEFAGKSYVISDTIQKQNWKWTGETKTILNYSCQKVTTQIEQIRNQTTIVNEKWVEEKVKDTLEVEAWFTSSIPVAVGPEYQAQLPGAILELNIGKGEQVYRALEITPTVNPADIKEPRKGKKVTSREYKGEMEKMIQGMQKKGKAKIMSLEMN